jgi:hypothetical protein
MDDYMFNIHVNGCKYVHEATSYLEIFNYSVRYEIHEWSMEEVLMLTYYNGRIRNSIRSRSILSLQMSLRTFSTEGYARSPPVLRSNANALQGAFEPPKLPPGVEQLAAVRMMYVSKTQSHTIHHLTNIAFSKMPNNQTPSPQITYHSAPKSTNPWS